MTQNNLESFIQSLPAGNEVKNALLVRLHEGDEEGVKAEVAAMLREAGLALSAVEAMKTTEADFEKDLKTVEDDAKAMAGDVQKQIDTQDLSEARQAIAGQ